VSKAFDLKALHEQRNRLIHQCGEIVRKAAAEDRDMNPDEKKQWDAMSADVDGLKVRCDNIERQMSMESDESDTERFATPTGTELRKEVRVEDRSERDLADRRNALRAWALGPIGKATERHFEAAQRLGFNPNVNELRVNLPQACRTPAEVRALTTQTDVTGKDLIPQGFVKELEVARLYYSGMRQVASVIRTESGNDLPWPTANDTTNEGAYITEGSAATDTTDPAFNHVVFKAYQLSSKIVRVPVPLLEDNGVNLEEELGKMLGVRLGRRENRAFTTGAGSTEPTGVVGAATLGADIAGTQLVYEDLVDLEHSVDPAYRESPDAAFMAHSDTIGYLKKLTDSLGRPLWLPGIAAGAPDRILNHKYVMNNSVESINAAGAQSSDGSILVLFGDFSKYKIRDVLEVKLVRLNERYAEYNQAGFVAWVRHDGNLLDAGTHPIKYLVG
jgi:HK97 family phage major capsid protein